jgi:PBP1b-binding outer membrane lipoprotein LpoB
MSVRTVVLALLSAALLDGCASSAVDENFGKSTAQLVRSQTYDPSTLHSPSAAPVEGIDPDVAKATIDSMRKDVPDRSAVRHDLQVKVGSQQNNSDQ